MPEQDASQGAVTDAGDQQTQTPAADKPAVSPAVTSMWEQAMGNGDAALPPAKPGELPPDSPAPENADDRKPDASAATPKAELTTGDDVADAKRAKRIDATVKQLKLEGDISKMTPEEIIDAAGRAVNAKFSEVGRLEKELRAGRQQTPEQTPDPQTPATNPAASGTPRVATFATEDWESGDGQEKMNAHLDWTRDIDEQVSGLREDIAELLETTRNHATDDFFAGLDADVYGGIFGQGPSGKLDAESDAYKNRVSIIDKAADLRHAYKLLGQKMPIVEALEQSAQVAFASEIREAQEQAAAKVRQRNRPTGSQRYNSRTARTTATSDDQKLIQTVGRMGAEFGLWR